ncbi:MAG: glycosyltransferase family 39 protein [Gemmatimonadota bacterium]
MTGEDRRGWIVALVVLTALAALARLINLDSGLWIDEVYSLVRSFREPPAVVLTTYWGDNHHPFYAILASLSRSVFGESAWSIRLPAMLFGVASVPLTALLAREVASRREALAAAAILALSYHHVWFSQNARGYSAIAFFTLLTMLFALRAVRHCDLRDWVGLSVAAALGAWTHLTMIFVSVGHALAVLIEMLRTRAERDRSMWSSFVLSFAGAGLLALLLYAPMLRDVIAFFSETESGLAAVSTPAWAALEGFRVLALGLSGGVLAVGVSVVAAGLAVFCAGLVSLFRRSPLFVLLLAMPVAVTLAGAAMARGTFYPRFLFFAIGPFLIVAVRGLFATCSWIGAVLRRPILGERLAITGVAAVALLSAASLGFNYRFPKQDFEGAWRHVRTARGPDDVVISTGVPADPYRTLYGENWPNVSSLMEVDSIRRQAGSRRVWVLYTFPRYIAATMPDLMALLRAECRESRVFRGTVGGGDVHVCHLDRE